MRLIGFIEGKLIHRVIKLSDHWLLYYEKGDKEDDIRAADFTNYGEFFNPESGDKINIFGLMNFELIDDQDVIIFDSKNRITDFDLAIQYHAFKNLLSGDLDNNVSLKN